MSPTLWNFITHFSFQDVLQLSLSSSKTTETNQEYQLFSHQNTARPLHLAILRYPRWPHLDEVLNLSKQRYPYLILENKTKKTNKSIWQIEEKHALFRIDIHDEILKNLNKHVEKIRCIYIQLYTARSSTSQSELS